MERGALLYVDVTVAELVAKYLPYAESYYTKHGVATSQTAIIKLATNVLLAKFSHLEARKSGPLALRAWQDELATQGLARNEVNRRIRLIREMFKKLINRRLSSDTLCIGGDRQSPCSSKVGAQRDAKKASTGTKGAKAEGLTPNGKMGDIQHG